MSYQSMSDDEFASPEYVPHSPIIIPATPPSELDSDNEDQKQKTIKLFRLTELPGVIISKLCNYLELDQILELKFDRSWPRCKHLQRYLTKKVKHNKIIISDLARLAHYRASRPYSSYLMSEVKEVTLDNFIDDLGYLSFFSSTFQLHTIMLHATGRLTSGLELLFDPKALKVMKISATRGSLLILALQALEVYVNVETLEIDQLDEVQGDFLDLSSDRASRMFLPNLKRLKVSLKNFMARQSDLNNITLRFPNLKEIEEPDMIWKLGGQWEAETEAVELKLHVSYKRKHIDLNSYRKTTTGRRCYACTRTSLATYTVNNKQVCLTCLMKNKPDYEIKQNIMNLVQQKKKQKICCKETQCNCDMILDESSISI